MVSVGNYDGLLVKINGINQWYWQLLPLFGVKLNSQKDRGGGGAYNI